MKTFLQRLPVERCIRSPELPSLDVLEAALTSTNLALLAAHAELAQGALDECPRGSSPLRARAIIAASHRLSAALVAYREALDREERRAHRSSQNRLF